MPKSPNILGMKFKMLTVVKKLNKRDKRGKVLRECICDCGNTCVKTTGKIKGRDKSCGCLNKMTVYDGEKYGMLRVLHETDPDQYKGQKRRRVICLCDCGNKKSFLLYNIRNGSTVSCGCYYRRLKRDQFTTHGMSSHEMYGPRRSMMTRCNIEKNKDYKDYGGRGIKVCKEREDINVFISDMYPSFKKGLTLDRIENNKGYSKSNCKRSTRKEQANNRRRNGAQSLLL